MKIIRSALIICMVSLYSLQPLRAQHTSFSNALSGVVVAHSPASSGMYIGSPSICKLSNGDYLASHDFFGPKSTQGERAITRIYRSKDKGKTWNRLAEINGQFWSTIFVHKNSVYLLGTWKEYGNTLIRKSTDGGEHWTDPADYKSGLLLEGRYHCSAMPVIEYKGRLWRAMEDAMGPVPGWGKMFGSFMMSVPVGKDLLNAGNWTFSNTLRYDSTYLGGKFGGWLEGNAVVDRSGNVINVLRASYALNDVEKAATIRISSNGETASFNPLTGFIDFPGGGKKFTIRYDRETKLYWTLANYIPKKFSGKNPSRIRNTQALCSSPDLFNWELKNIILQHEDVEKHGFQYIDWLFEGRDIIALCRTAFDDEEGGAHNQHDANFLTFHRIKNFRKLSLQGSE